jgi:hypothetical protein
LKLLAELGAHYLGRTDPPFLCREYLDNAALFQGCSDKLLDAISVLLREVQVGYCLLVGKYLKKNLDIVGFQLAPEEYLYRSGGEFTSKGQFSNPACVPKIS